MISDINGNVVDSPMLIYYMFPYPEALGHHDAGIFALVVFTMLLGPGVQPFLRSPSLPLVGVPPRGTALFQGLLHLSCQSPSWCGRLFDQGVEPS